MKYVITVFVLSFLVVTQVKADVISIVSRESTMEEKITAEFSDTPRMIPIIKCESGFKQFDNLGKPLRSGTSDVGILQINHLHWKRAKSLGLDIFNSVDDNIQMGKIILKEQGLNAWTCNKLI